MQMLRVGPMLYCTYDGPYTPLLASVLRTSYVRLQKLLLEVMGHKRLLESHDDTMLLQKIQLRAPYVTPLNVLQVPASALAPSLPAALPSLHLS